MKTIITVITLILGLTLNANIIFKTTDLKMEAFSDNVSNKALNGNYIWLVDIKDPKLKRFFKAINIFDSAITPAQKAMKKGIILSNKGIAENLKEDLYKRKKWPFIYKRNVDWNDHSDCPGDGNKCKP